MLQQTFATPNRKLFCISFIICCFVLMILVYKDEHIPIIINYDTFFTHNANEQVLNLSVNFSNAESKYLVSSSKCKIPDLDPFNVQAKEFYHRESYTPCRKLPLLTYLSRIDNSNNNITFLHIAKNLVPSYTKHGVQCCYSNVTRIVGGTTPDDVINISKCAPFTHNATIREETVLVRCRDAKTGKQIYENTHFAALTTPELHQKLTKTLDYNNTATKPLSVLFVGIDSISRLNFIRSLPSTHRFVENNHWLPLKGYNKIDDNTFPNLMAILTGLNQSRAYTLCNPRQVDKLDNCSMVWYDYRRLGYVTSYGEDEVAISTFNYNKKGFTQKPTDYYLRSYMIASEKLKIVRRDLSIYCTGPETYGERLMNAANAITSTYKDYPSFGFYWMNSFSHNKLNTPSGMDDKIKSFLENLLRTGILNSTIVVFLSDHGLRFGEIRYKPTGWLEERLPFIYFSFPSWFNESFPKEYQNFRNNINKLTTPYDLHMTLQHILVLSGFRDYSIRPSEACPNCTSLFDPIDHERSCEDAAIPQHWCTCSGYTPINADNKTVHDAATYNIEQIHEIIRKKRSDSKCAKFSLHRIISSSVSEALDYKNDTYLLIVFETKPKAVFEGTIQLLNHANKTTFSLVGGISRLDRYSSHSGCIVDTYLKMFCYCRK